MIGLRKKHHTFDADNVVARSFGRNRLRKIKPLYAALFSLIFIGTGYLIIATFAQPGEVKPTLPVASASYDTDFPVQATITACQDRAPFNILIKIDGHVVEARVGSAISSGESRQYNFSGGEDGANLFSRSVLRPGVHTVSVEARTGDNVGSGELISNESSSFRTRSVKNIVATGETSSASPQTISASSLPLDATTSPRGYLPGSHSLTDTVASLQSKVLDQFSNAVFPKVSAHTPSSKNIHADLPVHITPNNGASSGLGGVQVTVWAAAYHTLDFGGSYCHDGDVKTTADDGTAFFRACGVSNIGENSAKYYAHVDGNPAGYCLADARDKSIELTHGVSNDIHFLFNTCGSPGTPPGSSPPPDPGTPPPPPVYDYQPPDAPFIALSQLSASSAVVDVFGYQMHDNQPANFISEVSADVDGIRADTRTSFNSNPTHVGVTLGLGNIDDGHDHTVRLRAVNANGQANFIDLKIVADSSTPSGGGSLPPPSGGSTSTRGALTVIAVKQGTSERIANLSFKATPKNGSGCKNGGSSEATTAADFTLTTSTSGEAKYTECALDADGSRQYTVTHASSSSRWNAVRDSVTVTLDGSTAASPRVVVMEFKDKSDSRGTLTVFAKDTAGNPIDNLSVLVSADSSTASGCNNDPSRFDNSSPDMTIPTNSLGVSNFYNCALDASGSRLYHVTHASSSTRWELVSPQSVTLTAGDSKSVTLVFREKSSPGPDTPGTIPPPPTGGGTTGGGPMQSGRVTIETWLDYGNGGSYKDEPFEDVQIEMTRVDNPSIVCESSTDRTDGGSVSIASFNNCPLAASGSSKWRIDADIDDPDYTIGKDFAVNPDADAKIVTIDGEPKIERIITLQNNRDVTVGFGFGESTDAISVASSKLGIIQVNVCLDEASSSGTHCDKLFTNHPVHVKNISRKTSCHDNLVNTGDKGSSLGVALFSRCRLATSAKRDYKKAYEIKTRWPVGYKPATATLNKDHYKLYISGTTPYVTYRMYAHYNSGNPVITSVYFVKDSASGGGGGGTGAPGGGGSGGGSGSGSTTPPPDTPIFPPLPPSAYVSAPCVLSILPFQTSSTLAQANATNRLISYVPIIALHYSNARSCSA
jgi:hypothetical protein